MLYLVSPGGATMVDRGGENFIFWFATTHENAFQDTFFQRILFLYHKCFFVQRKSGGNMALRLLLE